MYTESTTVEEFRMRARSTVDTQLQFRWMQNLTLESPAWAIDDIEIDCLLNSYNCYKSVFFEETPE